MSALDPILVAVKDLQQRCEPMPAKIVVGTRYMASIHTAIPIESEAPLSALNSIPLMKSAYLPDNGWVMLDSEGRMIASGEGK